MKKFGLMLFAAPLFAWACGSATAPTDGGVDAGTDTNDVDAQDSSSDSSSADVVDAGPWHFIDGSGDCAPTGNGYAFQTCCNGQPCFGNCVADGVGDIQCNCAGISGGCTDGLVCCKVPSACVSESKCGLGQ